MAKNFGKLFVNDSGILMRRTVRYQQVVLPKCYHQLVHKQLHEEMGHLGPEKVIELAQQRFYWPGMATVLKDNIQKRCRCIVNKKPGVPEKAPLIPVTAQYPFEIVAVDFLKLDKCKGGFEYALVVTDHFTRFAQVYATKTKSSKAAADKIFNQFIMEFGWPSKIHSDLGGKFTSKLFAELHRISGIKSSKTTPYHPEGNGKAERFNRTLCGMLKTLSEESKRDWKTHLPKLSFAYNSTVHKSTGFSPFKLLFGRESTLPIDFIFQGVDREVKLKNQSHQQFLKEWGESMEEACKVAREKMGKMNIYNKQKYDKKAKAVEIEVKDHVLMQNRRDRDVGTGKLSSYWEHNIFEVIEKKEDLPVYRIRNINKKSDVRLVHRNLLMLCNDLPLDVFKEPEKKEKTRRVQLKQGGRTRSSQSEDVSSDEDSEVDAVVVLPSEVIGVENPVIAELMSEESEPDQDVSDAVPEVDDSDLVSVQDGDPGMGAAELDGNNSAHVVEEAEAEIEITDPVGEENAESAQEEQQVGVESEGHWDKIQNDSGVERVLILEDLPVESVVNGNGQEVDSGAEDGSQEESDSDEGAQPTRKSKRVKFARKIMTYNEPGGDPVLVAARR